MIEKRELESIIEPVISAEGYQFVGMELISQPGGPLLRLYVDKVGGISIDECGKISQRVGSVLDVEEKIQGCYTLEVSSPGIDRVLFTVDQCQQQLGKVVKMRLRHALEGGQKSFQGVLKAVNADQLHIVLDDDQELTVSFMDLEKIRLVPDWATKR